MARIARIDANFLWLTAILLERTLTHAKRTYRASVLKKIRPGWRRYDPQAHEERFVQFARFAKFAFQQCWSRPDGRGASVAWQGTLSPAAPAMTPATSPARSSADSPPSAARCSSRPRSLYMRDRARSAGRESRVVSQAGARSRGPTRIEAALSRSDRAEATPVATARRTSPRFARRRAADGAR